MNLDFIKDHLWNEYDIDNDYDLEELARYIWQNLDLDSIYEQIDKMMLDLKTEGRY